MERTEIGGGCFCGAIRYRVAAPPSGQVICHCANCRRAAGAQSVAWVTFPASSVTFARGEPASFRAENGAIWSFCSRCGTTLTYQHHSRLSEIDVTTGSLDDPEAFPPTKGVNLDEKLSWT